MHEEKQKEVALHDQTQEWKQLEHALNVEPLHFPEKGLIVMKLQMRKDNPCSETLV